MTERLQVDGTTYEYRTESEVGLYLGAPREWSGYRVKYRESGSRRWLSFLLVDHDHEPTFHELTVAIRAHLLRRGEC